MAAPINKERSQDHNRRKNSGSADKHRAAKRERNAARGKQVWVVDGPLSGHWEKIANG